MFKNTPIFLALLMLSLTAWMPHTQAEQPLRYVATGSRIGVYQQGTNTERTAFWHRTPHQLGGPVSEIQIGFMNWFLNYSNENTVGNTVTIEYAWLERASDGQVVPITFSGSRQLVMPANDVEPYWLGDTIDSSVWTSGTPQRDEVFWLHIKGSIPESGNISQGSPTGYSGSKFILYDPSNDPGTYDIAGTVPSITDQYARTRGLPTMFLGRFTTSGYLSVIGIGDSILDGSGDASSSYSTISGFGFFCRAAVDESGDNTIATFNLTRHGASATAPTKASNPRQQHFLKFANVAVEEYGTNDLGSSGSGDVSTIQGRLEDIWELCRQEGIQKIIRTQLMPRTSSVTYNWVSREDQTPNSGWGDVDAGDSGKRDALNAGFETSLENGEIDVLLENLAVVSDPFDDHYWLTNGSNDYMTNDGTHLRAAANILVAEVLREALLSITVDTLSYASWSDSIDWGSADASPEADPNNDRITNLMAYALNVSPVNEVETTQLPKPSLEPAASELEDAWFTYVYRMHSVAADLDFRILSNTNLTSDDWTDLSIDGIDTQLNTLDEDIDGDGSTILKEVRIRLIESESNRFLKLEVTAL